MRPGASVPRLVAAVIAVLAAAAALVGISASSPGIPRADLQLAADLGQFQPGNIISDTIFFDPSSMDTPTVQAFLNLKGKNCVPASDGTACLKDYRLTTTPIAGDSLCAGYTPGTLEPAALVITKVAWSCRVNPRVLLVLLQKEMGLVTTSWPTARKYDRATGYYCPDNAGGWCDPAYAGLENQLYNAAHQYQRYAAHLKGNYVAGAWNNIQYNPTTACGTQSVFIANQATAGLYDYTPYVPNAAALAAGYGSGDGCSAYGNRNFWLYYTDWFGSTQSPGGSAVVDKYNSMGATTGSLGAPTGGVVCGLAAGGCLQGYAGGAIYWSPASGAHVVSGALRDKWGTLGWENSVLGYPTGDPICGLRDGGCVQSFSSGAIYTAPAAGAHVARGAIQAWWGRQGWEGSALGYPTSDTTCGLLDGGCWQSFQGGTAYWSTLSGVHQIGLVANSSWAAQGWENGPLRYPTGDQVCGLLNGGCLQAFEGGTIYSSTASGTHAVRSGAILNAWTGQLWERGPLGYPTGDQVCGLRGGGCFQSFQNGSIYSSGSGAHAVSGAVASYWGAQKWEQGPLGYPTADQVCGLKDSGCFQRFQGGSVYVSASTAAQSVSGTVAAAWAAQLWERGPLGYPTGDQVCGLPSAACSQTFQGGAVYGSPATGTHPVTGVIGARWTALGGSSSAVGYPIADVVCGLADSGCFQAFQHGSIYASASTPATAVVSPIADIWAAQKWERGPLGYPTADQVCGLSSGGCRQAFQAGAVYTSPSGGTQIVSGAIGNAWASAGAERSTWGYPASGTVCGLRLSGCYQAFEHGAIYSTATTGSYGVSGAIQQKWASTGWENGPLGYPTADAVTTTGGASQQFERGTLTWDAATGTVTTTTR